MVRPMGGIGEPALRGPKDVPGALEDDFQQFVRYPVHEAERKGVLRHVGSTEARQEAPPPS
jgi:hypothetical protein